MMVPRLRGRMCRSAAIVPCTKPRYVTSVTRRNSSGVISHTGEKTVTIASLIRVDAPEMLLDELRRGEHSLRVGHLSGRDHSGAPELFDLFLDLVERLGLPADQSE